MREASGDAASRFRRFPSRSGHGMNALDVLGPTLRAAIEQFVDQRVEQRLAAVLHDVMKPEERSPYMSVRECAAFLRCSEQRINDLTSSGRLRRSKDGTRTLLDRQEVEEYVARGGGR